MRAILGLSVLIGIGVWAVVWGAPELFRVQAYVLTPAVLWFWYKFFTLAIEERGNSSARSKAVAWWAVGCLLSYFLFAALCREWAWPFVTLVSLWQLIERHFSYLVAFGLGCLAHPMWQAYRQERRATLRRDADTNHSTSSISPDTPTAK